MYEDHYYFDGNKVFALILSFTIAFIGKKIIYKYYMEKNKKS